MWYFAISRLPKIKEWVDKNNPGDPIIPFSVALEEEFSRMTDEEKADAQKEPGKQSCLGKITNAGYTSLDVCERRFQFEVFTVLSSPFRFQLIRYFTCGPDEVRAWTIRRGTKAPQAAGVIQYVLILSIAGSLY